MGVLTSSSIFIQHGPLINSQNLHGSIIIEEGPWVFKFKTFLLCMWMLDVSVCFPTLDKAQLARHTEERSDLYVGETDPNAWCSIEEPPRQETLSCTSSSHVFCLTNYHSDTLDLCHFLFIVYAINSNNVEKKRIRPTFKTLLHPWRGEKFGRWRNKQSVCSREGSWRWIIRIRLLCCAVKDEIVEDGYRILVCVCDKQIIQIPDFQPAGVSVYAVIYPWTVYLWCVHLVVLPHSTDHWTSFQYCTLWDYWSESSFPFHLHPLSVLHLCHCHANVLYQAHLSLSVVSSLSCVLSDQPFPLITSDFLHVITHLWF